MQRLPVSVMDNAERGEVATMLKQAYGEFRPHMQEQDWEKMAAALDSVGQDRGAFNFVSHIGGELARHIAYYPPGAFTRFDLSPHTAFIRLLGVAPQFRGRSLARDLTHEAIELAQSAGAKAIALHTNELMVSAQALYRSIGFREIRRLPDALGLRYALYEMTF